MLPLMAALRSADSRGQGCLLPTPDGHMGGDFQRGCTHTHTGVTLAWPGAHTLAHLRADPPLTHPHPWGVNYGKGFLINTNFDHI